MKRTTEVALLAGTAVTLTYASHVAAMVLVTWRAMVRHKGRGHGGERIRDHLPPYAYPRRRLGPGWVDQPAPIIRNQGATP